MEICGERWVDTMTGKCYWHLLPMCAQLPAMCGTNLHHKQLFLACHGPSILSGEYQFSLMLYQRSK